jgi:hypothetical protein
VLLLSGIELLDLPGRTFLIPVVLASGAALVLYVEFRRLNGRVAAVER